MKLLSPWPLLAFALLAGCDRQQVEAPPPSPPAFVEAAGRSGLDFVHFNGMSGALYFVEMVGSGAALLDYDNDGDLDLYLVQGRMLGDKALNEAIFPPRSPLSDRLYRNDLRLQEGVPILSFTDVSETAGIDSSGYGMGVAAGDYDNDGWVDLYVTRFGGNLLLHNRGDGSFEEMTEQAGVDDPRWSTSAMFVDTDGDGWLDLYNCNYVSYTLATHRACFSNQGAADYCGPKSYEAQPDRLFRNHGDGSFENATGASGIAREYGPCLGVAAADFNGDRRVDLYVANDGAANQLWINQGGNRFENDALFSGTALNRDGMAEASMGVDAADFDNDGDVDLFLTHLDGESNTLYRNDGQGLFSDATNQVGLEAPSRPFTGFGTAWLDYDNDGWLDLFAANGAVHQDEAQLRAGDPYPLKQKNLFFRNLGGGRFAEISHRLGPAFALAEVSRGTAVGDIDNDGDTDIVVTNNAGPVRLLLNEVGNRNAWLGLRLVDPTLQRDVYGARVAVYRKALPPLWRRVRVAASYLSANDPRILVGLGEQAEVDRVEVHWPDGSVEAWHGLAPRQYHRLQRGAGESVRSDSFNESDTDSVRRA